MISHEATNLVTITKVLSVNLERLFYDNSMTFYDNLRVFEKHLDYFFKDFWKLKRKLRDFKSFCNSYQKNLTLGKFAVYKKCLWPYPKSWSFFMFDVKNVTYSRWITCSFLASKFELVGGEFLIFELCSIFAIRATLAFNFKV